MERYFQRYMTEKGEIIILYNIDGITNVFLPYDNFRITDDLHYREDEDIRRYFNKYFSGQETEKLKLNAVFTDFQSKVFEVLQDTQRGTLMTYGDIAGIIGCSSPRAIGQALKRNPVPIIIPCHRVIGKGWRGGFGGETCGQKMDFKGFLMKVEGNGGWLP